MNKKGSMNSNRNKNIIYSCILFILLVFSILFYSKYNYYKNIYNNIHKTDTVLKMDTLYKDTTITVFKEKPVPKYIYVTKRDTVYDKEGNEIELKTESKLYQDTLCNKSDSIILKSYISGVNPILDSISAEWKKRETTITNTVEITKYIEKEKTFFDRFHIGIQAGYGYTFNSKTFQPYVGLGIGFDL